MVARVTHVDSTRVVNAYRLGASEVARRTPLHADLPLKVSVLVEHVNTMLPLVRDENLLADRRQSDAKWTQELAFLLAATAERPQELSGSGVEREDLMVVHGNHEDL